MLPASPKGVLFAHQRSSVIYEYKCHCDDSRYVGRTYLRLQDCIKQHVPKWLQQHTGSQQMQLNERARKNNPLQNAIQPLDSIYKKTTNALPTTMKTNFAFWTQREVVSILLCLKPATSEYSDLIYANRKSLFTLSICSSRLQAIAMCPITSRVTISHFISQCSIASWTSEIADKYHSSLRRDYPLMSASRKAYGINSFFQSFL